MSGKWLPWGLSMIAIGAFGAFLWFVHWMQSIPIPYMIMVNFAIMGLVWFVFDIHKPALNSRWFETTAFERSGRVYGVLGVPWFIAAQQRLGWNQLIGVPSLARSEELWKQREWGTRFGEATHWACLLVLIPIAGWSLLASEGAGWSYWLVSAIVLHLYPIMLQRYLRPRFRRLISKMKKSRRAGSQRPE